jgi:hypothetical protein
MLTNEPGGDGPVLSQITVDVQGLRDFANLLQDELDANLRPSKERIAADHGRGVGFGLKNASADMRIAVAKYHECLSAAVANLESYVAASEILIAAAHKVAEAYHSAEQLSAARLADVEIAFREAVAEADALHQTAQRRAADQRLIRLEREGLL